MSQRALARRLCITILVVGCSGLDPGAFRPQGSPSAEPEAAGWSFDAGTAPGTSGPAGSSGSSRSGSSGRSGAGSDTDSDGGEAGEGNEGGAGAAPNAGSGGVRGGPAGSGGARAGSGGARAGNGGARAGGGFGGGRANGGTAGIGAGARAGAAAGGQGGTPARHALYFSEYVEGSSSYKALEITAREASTLAGCRLVTYFNGSSAGSGIALDGAVAAGESYVLCSTALATLLDAECERATNLTFNGDDALALECDGVAIDVIGQIGVDPGDAWGSGDSSTLNHTLRRSCAASAGDRDGSDPFDPSDEWASFPVDAFDALGREECGG